MTQDASARPRHAVYPGSFDPPTIAHVAIARAALVQCACDSITLVLSVGALGKHDRDATVTNRHAALTALFAHDDRIRVATTSARLIAEIAEGFDVVVVGADKWEQVTDPVWYEDGDIGRDRALAALPHVAVVPRPPIAAPPSHPQLIRTLTILDLDDATLAEVSSTGARSNRPEWIAQAPVTALDRKAEIDIR